MPKVKKTKYALLSVWNKEGIADLAKFLVKSGFEIISTGGTAKTLAADGVKLTSIEKITGNPESFDGRMKTVSFHVESGILYNRTNPSHVKQAKNLKIPKIDIVVCNLYPFEKTISDKNVKLDTAVESIDVGGPTMVRAAAKNFNSVLVIVDPNDYEKVKHAIESKSDTKDFRQALAAKAFEHLSFYDSQIARHLNKNKFPEEIVIPGRLLFKLRYGENPHQEGAVYADPNTNSPLAKLKKLAGKELSGTNYTDISAGLESVRAFDEPCVVVIKHNSPCGIAIGKSIKEALVRGIEADPLSAFGGVVIFNRPLDIDTARKFAQFKENKVQVDIIAAPEITKEAVDFLKNVRKSTGLYSFGKIPNHRMNSKQIKPFYGGFIIQDWDDTDPKSTSKNWIIPGKKPTKKQFELMKFGWKIISRIKSNTVIVVDPKKPMTRGIGSGQTSRIGSAEIALKHAGKYVKGGILVSDSFFPFDDCVKLAATYKIGAIIQQGGSVRDKDSIDAANAAGIPMVLTGERKFWH